MTGGVHNLILATATFVLAHFILSSRPLRGSLITRFGEGPFRAGYSIVVALAFVWMLAAYVAAPYVPLWTPPAWTAWLPLLAMPLVAFLLVCAFTTRNVTLVGGEIQGLAKDPAPGIMRVTRHPFLVGAIIWALAHVPVNGDAASLVLFSGIAILAGFGMTHIDRRRRRTMGSAWGPIALTTSAVPFVALIAGRARFDWRGIGLWRVVAALGLYVALLLLHQPVIGVSPLPPL